MPLAPVSAEVVEHGGQYFPGPAGIAAVWCSADEHPIIPVGDPDEYSSPTDWLFSGTPECALGEVHNRLRAANGQDRVENGVGGFMWKYYPSHVGSLATAWTDDAAFAADTYMALDGGPEPENQSEGCGAQTVVLADQWYAPWLDWDPLFAALSEAGVTADLEVCFSSMGWITARYGG